MEPGGGADAQPAQQRFRCRWKNGHRLMDWLDVNAVRRTRRADNEVARSLGHYRPLIPSEDRQRSH